MEKKAKIIKKYYVAIIKPDTSYTIDFYHCCYAFDDILATCTP